MKKSWWMLFFLVVFFLGGCTYFQSISAKDDKYYIAAQVGWSVFIWENRIYECQKIANQEPVLEGKGANCFIIYQE